MGIQTASSQGLDDSWIVSVYGRSVQVNPDGSYRIPNITLLDEFGESQQDRFDWLSDDYIRLTGFSLEGDGRFVTSRPFQLRFRGDDIRLRNSDLTISPSPTNLVEFVRLETTRRSLGMVGETAQITTKAFMPNSTATFDDNTFKDVSRRDDFTTYRSSNPRIATVSKDGLVTAVSRGRVFISAVHDNISAAIQLNMDLPLETTVAGQVSDANGDPVSNATVQVVGGTATAQTDGDGRFDLGSQPLPGGLGLQIAAFTPDGRSGVQVLPPNVGETTVYNLSLSLNRSDVFGRVVDSDGFPVTGVSIEIPQVGMDNRFASTGTNGAFSVTNVTGASVTVFASTFDGRQAAASAAVFSNGVVDVGTIVLPDPLPAMVSGTLVDAAGNPVTNGFVAIQGRNEGVAVSADGSFQFPALPASLGDVVIVASAPSLGTGNATVSLVQGQDSSAGAIQLDPGGNRDFIAVFQPNSLQAAPALSLLIAATEAAASGQITFGSGAAPLGFSVAAGDIVTVQVPNPAANHVRAGDGIESVAIRVNADAPIRLTGLNQAPNSTDAFRVLPVESLGTDYSVLSYEQFDFSANHSQFAVAALEANTRIRITPSIDIGTNRTAGVSFVVTLGALDVYQLTTTTTGDLTGSRVESLDGKPIAVFAGNACANVPLTSLACDHLAEQLPPESDWGTQFIAAPFTNRTLSASDPAGDTFRVLAKEDGTRLQIMSATTNQFVFLAAGEFWEGVLEGLAQFEATKPVLVAQYANGSTFSRPDPADFPLGDPFMQIVKPASSFQYTHILSPIQLSGTTTHYLNIIAHRDDVTNGTLLLNGVPIDQSPFSFEPIPGTNFRCAKAQLTTTPKLSLTSTRPSQATLYGFSGSDSYGF